MQKAGGMIALIAGIFGVLAAVATLLLGGFGTLIEGEGAGTVVALGFGGIATSFLTIIFGALAMNTRGRAIGVFLIISALIGVVIGGPFVAICMLLAVIGGILATVGRRER